MTVEEKSWKPTIFLWFFLFFSKGIADYITRCKQAIGKFESLVHQIHKNADDISSRLTLIESINLFKYPAPKSEDELPGRADFLFLWLWKEREKPLGHGGTHTCTDGIKPYLTNLRPLLEKIMDDCYFSSCFMCCLYSFTNSWVHENQ